MNIFFNMWQRIAKKLGIQLVEKEKALHYAKAYSNSEDINITALMANTLSTLTLMDMSISVMGENSRAKYMDIFAQHYSDTAIKKWADVVLGTGDAIIKPSISGKHIAVDIIKNSDFRIVECFGDRISGVLIKCDEKVIDNATYQRIEYHRLDDSGLYMIAQIALKDGEDTPVNSVSGWEGIIPVQYIGGVNRMLFGRGKCPIVNRDNVNDVNGVPITYGADALMKKAVEHIEGFNYEYRAKQAVIFGSKQVLKHDKDTGALTLPNGTPAFLELGISEDKKDDKIHEYSPGIRSAEMAQGIDISFKMIELFTGFSSGILTRPETNYATATEMRAALQKTWAFITTFRKVIESATNDLLYAVDVLCNANNVTPIGTWKAVYDWEDTLIEQTESKFRQLVDMESIGAIEKAEIRSWALSEDLTVAQKRVEEIAAKEPKIDFSGKE